MSTQTKQAQLEIKENIMTMFEFHKLPEEEQMEATNTLGKIIFQMVLIRVLPLMEEDHVSQYEVLIDGDVAPDELMDFFFDKVPNFLQVVTEETNSFHRQAAEALKQVQSL